MLICLVFFWSSKTRKVFILFPSPFTLFCNWTTSHLSTHFTSMPNASVVSPSPHLQDPSHFRPNCSHISLTPSPLPVPCRTGQQVPTLMLRFKLGHLRDWQYQIPIMTSEVLVTVTVNQAWGLSPGYLGPQTVLTTILLLNGNRKHTAFKWLSSVCFCQPYQEDSLYFDRKV